MRKIGFFNIGKLGLVKSAGTGKTDINKVIEEWIPKHMVFWYDMSKPVDVYIPGVTYASQFINDGGKLKYDTTINKCTITHTPTTTNRNFWQITCASSSTIDSYKIRVTGLPKGFTIQSGFYSNKITSDGEYDIASYTNTATSTRYVGFYLAGDNVSDVDCNIVVEEIPTRQSVPTNEILKANPYLQDFSGNNRPLKLNNFLFAAMSGVGGYETNFSDNSIWISSPQHGNIINNHTYNPMLKGSSSGLYTATGLVKVKFKATVTGMKSGYRLEFGSGDVAPSDKSIYEDGEYEFGSGDVAVPYGFKLYADDYSNPNTDVIIELKEVYPNALVTDGVDDYGVVENLQQGVKMLFYTCNPFSLNKIFYDQTKQGWRKFNIYNQADKIAYNERNENGVTYIDGNLNSLLLANDLVNKKQIITIVNEGSDANNTISPIYFSVNQHNGYFANLAFYNSIGFDSVPTKQNDGFTEQDLIDYYIPKAIVTITVVDVSGSPIQDAVVTVGGIQYKTLSDGTVKVRGMANSTMSLSVKKDGYMPFSDNSWKFADSRITLEVLRNTVITENGYSILLENDGLILTE
jgi:hypothetical protein